MELDFHAVTEEAVSWLKDLLRIDTTNPPGNERPAADYIARIFDREGIRWEIHESEPTRASIVARLPGSGKHAPLLLNGHLDVVPADPQHWTHPPFEAVEADGCIWGRGAVDMKNMVTMGVMTLVALRRVGVELDRDVIFAGVADEEAGSLKGSDWLVEHHPDLVRAEYVLNEVGGHTLWMGETRFYPVQVAEKGICWFEITASGEPGHGSMPHSDNAVVKLARAIERLGSARLPPHHVPVVEQFLRTVARGAPFPQNRAMPLLLQPKLADYLLGVLGRVNTEQAIGINAMLRNTCSPTMLDAGKKVNVIPSVARAQVDGRVLPGQTVAQFLDEVRRVVGDEVELNVDVQHEAVTFPSDTPLFDAIERAIGRHDPEGRVVPYMIPGFSDSFAYAKLGAVCYGFAPVKLGKDINFTRMYHGHDERIPREGFAWGLRVLYDLVHDFCAKQ